MSDDVQKRKKAALEATIDQGLDPSSEIVEIKGGVEVEVRAPTIDWEPTEDTETRRLCEVVARCCFVPGTDERVFDKSHLEPMAKAPDEADGWFAKLLAATHRVRGLLSDDPSADDRLDVIGETAQEGRGAVQQYVEEGEVPAEVGDELINRFEEIDRLREMIQPGNETTR